MMRKSSPLGGAAGLVLVLVLLMLAALSVPMRRGASLWQAIAVLPQPVLWAVPIVVAAPVLAALALRVRPHWHSVRDKSRDTVPTGSLRTLADAIRRASDSRFARSHVVARLVRLSTSLAAAHGAVSEEEAWQLAQRRLEETAPHVAAFLRREESAAHLSRAEFRQLVEDTLTHLERQQEEA
jgi:hypothetical protein